MCLSKINAFLSLCNANMLLEQMRQIGLSVTHESETGS